MRSRLVSLDTLALGRREPSRDQASKERNLNPSFSLFAVIKVNSKT